MGYETRIHVVALYNWTENPKLGDNIASLDLCVTSGAVDSLVAKYKKKPSGFALYASLKPDCQKDAIEFLKNLAEDGKPLCDYSPDAMKQLASDLEHGFVSKDSYDESLAIIPIEEFIEALRQELKNCDYRRYRWAIALLTAIHDEWKMNDRLYVVTYGH